MRNMRLSDLVAMADGSDPEVVVYAEDGECWTVKPAHARLSEGRIVLHDEGADDPVMSWDDGVSRNPLAPR